MYFPDFMLGVSSVFLITSGPVHLVSLDICTVIVCFRPLRWMWRQYRTLYRYINQYMGPYKWCLLVDSQILKWYQHNNIVPLWTRTTEITDPLKQVYVRSTTHHVYGVMVYEWGQVTTPSACCHSSSMITGNYDFRKSIQWLKRVIPITCDRCDMNN